VIQFEHFSDKGEESTFRDLVQTSFMDGPQYFDAVVRKIELMQ